MSAEDQSNTEGGDCKQEKVLPQHNLGENLALSQGQQLDYIADMVQALKAIAAQARCRTLTNLLELAHREALQRRGAGGCR